MNDPPPPPPPPPPPSPTFTARRAVAALLGLIACLALDLPIRAVLIRREWNFDHTSLAQFLRSGGYIPLWLVVAAAVWMEDRRRVGRWSRVAGARATRVAAASFLGGIAAETLKAIFRRQRMTLADGWYTFRPLWDRPFDTGGLSMPSSHALVAFAAAFTLGDDFRAARPVLLCFATATALSRVYSNAHFVSDVYVSMVVGWCLSRALAPRRATPRPLPDAPSADAPAGDRRLSSPA